MTTLLEDGPGEISAFLIHDGALYWSTSNNVRRIPIEGGLPADIGNSQIDYTEGCASVMFDGHDLYCSQFFGIVRMSDMGGPTTIVARFSSMWNGTATLQGDSFYWNASPPENQQGSVMTMSKGGGAQITLFSGGPVGTNIEADNESLYWSVYGSHNGALLKLQLAGAVTTTIVTTHTHLPLFRIEGDDIFWVDTDAGTVLKMPKAGGAITTLAAGQVAPYELAVDANSVYWMNDETCLQRGDGALWKVSRSGGRPELLVSGQGSVRQYLFESAMTVDDTSLYWESTTGMQKLTPK